MTATTATCLSPLAAGRIRTAAGATYPAECCGVLLARRAAASIAPRIILRALSVDNAAPRRGRRYRIPAEAIRRIERREERHGHVIVGFYHSHPDGSAEPSPRDVEFAWPWYTYLIVPVAAGVVGDARAWRLAGDRHGFEEERLVIASDEEAR